MTEKSTTSYTPEQRENLIEMLDEMHGNPYADKGTEIVKRTFLVMSFTEYDDGIAASLGVFGSKGLSLTGEIAADSERIANMDLATISCSIAAKQINKNLTKYTDEAQGVKMGARLFAKKPESHMKDCCICGESVRVIDTHNPAPLGEKDTDRCCDSCNTLQVIPARIAATGASS